MVGRRELDKTSLRTGYVSGTQWQCKFPKRNRKQLLTLFTTLLQPVVVLMPFYNGTEAEGRAKFKPFLDIGICTFQLQTGLNQFHLSTRAYHGYNERTTIRGG